MKKLFIAFAVVSATFAVNASYLYWTVDSSVELALKGTTSGSVNYTYNSSGDDGATNFSYARVVDNTGKALTIGNVDASGTYTPLGTSYATPGTYVIDLSGYSSSSSFYIEYLAYTTAGGFTQVGQTKTEKYSDLQQYCAELNSTGLTPISTVNVSTTWHGSGAVNTPEPTSGMLVLLGMAMLGLKRRKLNKVA